MLTLTPRFDGNGSKMRRGQVVYPKDMDKLMIPICNLFNRLPHIETSWCCQGHLYTDKKKGVTKWDDAYIAFLVEDIRALNLLTRIVREISDRMHDICDLSGVYDRWHDQGDSWMESQCGFDRVRYCIRAKLTCAAHRRILFKVTKDVIRHVLNKELKTHEEKLRPQSGRACEYPDLWVCKEGACTPHL